MDRTSWTILVLIAMLALHLVEEVKAGFREKFPPGEMPRWLFMAINGVIYTFCFTTLFLSLHGHALAIPFAWVFAITMLLNGVGHLGFMLLKREYFPGGLTAPGLIVVSSALI
jgi:hypothetical protein